LVQNVVARQHFYHSGRIKREGGSAMAAKKKAAKKPAAKKKAAKKKK
jgi:hypothetical protein